MKLFACELFKTSRLSIATLVCGTVFAADIAQADGFRNPPEGATSIGLAGGRVHIQDPSAVALSPANTATMTERQIMASFTFGHVRREFTGASGVTERTKDPWGVLPAYYLVWPCKESGLVAGLGVTVPYGRFTQWGRDVSFANASPYFAQLYVVSINPTIAKQVSDDLSLAAGVSLYYSDFRFEQGFPWSMLTMNPADPDGTAWFKSDGIGFGANAAARWQVSDGHVVIVTIRAPFDIDYDGSFRISDLPPAAGALGATSSSQFESEIRFPTVISLGYGFDVSESVRVEFNVEWVEASRNESIPIDIKNNSFLLPSPVIPQYFDDNRTVGAGVEWDVDEEWTTRAGLIYIETPSPTSTIVPVAYENDQVVVSVGASRKSEHHILDFGYAVGFQDSRTVSDNLNPAVNGVYNLESHLLAIAYRRSF